MGQTFRLGLLLLVVFVAAGMEVAGDEEGGEKDPGKFPESEKNVSFRRKEILIVSTLDGAISAVDPDTDGSILWTVGTGPGPMLSSTISRMELTSNAKWVRLIPSLAGGLYKFDGETVEPVPMNAEQLLKTSFKFADNTVMTGGKESRVYGINIDTGRIKYECNMEGCFGPTGEEVTAGEQDDLDDLIVVRRETQTVRAVEPKNGVEKWNFSVSSHHITYQPGVDELCSDDSVAVNDDVLLKAVVPDGVICQVDSKNHDRIKWKQTFSSPIVHAWRVINGQLVPINLFSSSHLPNVGNDNDNNKFKDPSLYIGTYNQQLYIQESRDPADAMLADEVAASHNSLVPHDYPRVTWRPYLVSASSRTPIIDHGYKPDPNDNPRLPMLTHDGKSTEDTALAVFKDGGPAYPYDSGFYLYPDTPTFDYDLIEDITNHSKSEGEDSAGYASDESDDGFSSANVRIIQIVFVSMWYWWQEIVLISILTALVMNVLITQPIIRRIRENFHERLTQLTRRRPDILVVERRVEVPYEVQVEVPVPKTPDSGSATDSNTTFSRSASLNSRGEFVSRFLTDYEPVQVLGSGGFGVVFESKNKLDETHYAVKRVRLPSRDEDRTKVMREVRCLAKLDQKNIVRYYNTWLEYPPADWQDEVDKKLLHDDSSSMNLASATSAAGDATSASTKSRNPLRFCPTSATDLSERARAFSSTGDNPSSSSGVAFEADESSGGIRFCDESKAEAEDALEWDARNLDKKRQPVFMYIVMQLCQKDSLRTWLRDVEVRSRARSLAMFSEICHGVEYVHSQGVVHRDLKPSNIFFAGDGTIKIGDFGLATVGINVDAPEDFLSDPGSGLTEQVGTELYMSPEQRAKLPYNHKVDIYSLGVVLFELLVPFATQMERADTLVKVRSGLYPDHFVGMPEHNLVAAMLSDNPSGRPEAADILQMDFMVDIDEAETPGGGDMAARKRRHRRSTGSNP